jgi:hypothetical protein
MADDKRTHMVMVRFNVAELERLNTLRGLFGMSKSEYLRSRALSDVMTKGFKVPELNRQAWIELSRAASNLNQIAHHLNATQAEELGIAEISQALSHFRESLIGASVFVEQEEDA